MKEALFLEDLDVLKNAIQESVRQMIVVEVSSPLQTRQLARQIGEWATKNQRATCFFDANSDRADSLWQQCHLALQIWEPDADNPGLLIVGDESTPYARTAHPTAQLPTNIGFWRGMNQLREKWDSLPAQIVFLVTSDQYPFFSTEADHLKRWISLKLHWLVDSPAVRPSGGQAASSTLSDALISEDYGYDDLDDRQSALHNRESLHERLRLARQREGANSSLAQRYYLPLMASAIALENWEEASSYDQALREVALGVKPRLRWLRLKSVMYFRQGRVEEALQNAKLWLEEAEESGNQLDKLHVLYFLAYIYAGSKRLDEAEATYREALALAPDNPVFLGVYAVFLESHRQNNERAEEYYQRALDANPNNVNNLGNYAVFLENLRQDYDRAEEYYRRALDANPTHATILGNYALFLDNWRHDYDRAEEYYQRALDADPTHANHLGNYALFLEDRRQDYDRAEEYYQRALDADPTQANNLGNYAVFLKNRRQDYDRAEEYFQRALDVDPTHATILGNYAVFLEDQRQDYDRAEEYYQRALDADPTDANNLGNYALFLDNRRQDYDRAEEYFQRALDADPTHATNLGNYAVFLDNGRQDYDRAEEYFQRALDADPTHSGHLNNYAVFLENQR